MKPAEIREKTEVELMKLEDKLRRELAAMQMQARAGQLAETSKIGLMKRDIARILSVRNQKKPEEGRAKK